jgi:hypothetical protein
MQMLYRMFILIATAVVAAARIIAHACGFVDEPMPLVHTIEPALPGSGPTENNVETEPMQDRDGDELYDVLDDPAWNADDNLQAYYEAVMDGRIPWPVSFV